MIKERKKTAQIPIIFLTAYYNEDQHVLEGYGAGAVDYLHKPVNPDILRSKVAVFAELYRMQREIRDVQPRAARGGDRAAPGPGAAARTEQYARAARDGAHARACARARPCCKRRPTTQASGS